jgi:flavin-dependent dehydrogenase
MESIDILIIGGGPAGISTAMHLVQSAPQLTSRILILEKAHYPRPKLCGGGLVKDAEILLDHLGLDVDEVPSVKAKKLHLDYKGNGIGYTQPGGHALRIIRRDEFDTWFANKAKRKGILIREGIRVRNLQVENDHVIVRTDVGDIHAQVVVGADGSNGITRKSVFPNFSGSKARVLEMLTPPSGQNSSQHSVASAFFDFHTVPQGIAGYVWDFPTQVDGRLMRCRGIYDANLFTRKYRPPLKEPLFNEIKNDGWNPSSLELNGHPINWFNPFNVFSKNRVLLVGDAAGADPLFGEGISIALGYGKVAAETIIRALKHQEYDFIAYKQRLMLNPLGQALTARWALAKIIYRFHWGWFHFLLWRVIKPITRFVAWLFLLNWGKRMS